MAHPVDELLSETEKAVEEEIKRLPKEPVEDGKKEKPGPALRAYRQERDRKKKKAAEMKRRNRANR